ncbi:MAG TPA: 3-hydroxyacyl-CoA dehydrogenase family protein [Propionibacteriaceae bacterium]
MVTSFRVTRQADGTGPIVAVVGAGTLGVTAAHAALTAGSSVTLLVRDRTGSGRDVETKAAAVRSSLHREVRRGAMTPTEATTLLDRLRVTTDHADLATAGVVVEAVPEDLPTKLAVIDQIEAHVTSTCVIASSTSSIPAAWLAAKARHPERVVVTHYVWPAHRMPLVEVALHDATSQSARARVAALLLAQGKTVLRVADRPGFLITRALLAYWSEAVRLVVDGVEPVEVDRALETFGMPLGPLRMLDAAGIGTAVAVHNRLAPSMGSEAPPLGRLQTVVNRGLTGFYDRTAAGRTPNEATVTALRGSEAAAVPSAGAGPGADAIVDRVIGGLAREVDRAVDEGVVSSWPDAARAIDLAYGFPAAQGGLQGWWSSRITDPTSRPSISVEMG